MMPALTQFQSFRNSLTFFLPLLNIHCLYKVHKPLSQKHLVTISQGCAHSLQAFWLPRLKSVMHARLLKKNQNRADTRKVRHGVNYPLYYRRSLDGIILTVATTLNL